MLSPYNPTLHRAKRDIRIINYNSHHTLCDTVWFGLLPFRSPLLREYNFVSIPPGTEMFHFPGCAPFSCENDHRGLLDGVSPFRNLRIKGC